MATILSLKRRIQAARNVSKTTRAMQMISASKLKRAQDAALSTRPYVEKLDILTKNIVGKIDKSTFSHPYISEKNTSSKELLLVLAPDKGLCGSMLSNLLREIVKYQKEHQDKASYLTVGKKAEGKVARMSDTIVASFPFGTTTPSYDMIYPILRIVDEYYLTNKVDRVKVLFTHFTSFFSQTPTFSTLLPITLDEAPTEETTASSYLFEPSPAEILPSLLKHHIEMSLYHFLVESFVSEQASRMLAMQNATNNANDIIEDLLLEYNKTRQAKITSELLDITGAGIASAGQ